MVKDEHLRVPQGKILEDGFSNRERRAGPDKISY